MGQVKSFLTILDSSEEPYSEGEDGKDLTSAIFTMEYAGDLKARSILMELKTYNSPDNASVYGLERVTGSLNGKAGTFVIEHIGIKNKDILVSTRTIMPGSATGELTGLKGKADFHSIGKEKAEITFEVSFE
jgi:hypothetical protein